MLDFACLVLLLGCNGKGPKLMYAISHAATALLLKKEFPTVKMFWLLISAQLIELLWVLFNYIGVEHFSVQDSVVHLGHIAWSHSILSTATLALLAWVVIAKGFNKAQLGIALGLGILSHIILDFLTHEPDLQLTPWSAGLSFGLNIQNTPLLAFLIEVAYGAFCWWYFKGRKSLLVAIVILNILNIPFIFRLNPHGTALLVKMPFILPTIILIQILYTWYFVWLFSREPKRAD